MLVFELKERRRKRISARVNFIGTTGQQTAIALIDFYLKDRWGQIFLFLSHCASRRGMFEVGSNIRSACFFCKIDEKFDRPANKSRRCFIHANWFDEKFRFQDDDQSTARESTRCITDVSFHARRFYGSWTILNCWYWVAAKVEKLIHLQWMHRGVSRWKQIEWLGYSNCIHRWPWQSMYWMEIWVKSFGLTSRDVSLMKRNLSTWKYFIALR